MKEILKKKLYFKESKIYLKTKRKSATVTRTFDKD